MAGYKGIPEHETVTVALGVRGSRRLDPTLHMQVLELWATENKACWTSTRQRADSKKKEGIPGPQRAVR